MPDIQTIFLTRPTQSEGLLMQMIGRGLRGVQARGTEKAIIVDFCDKWDTFNKWLNPAWIMGESEEPGLRPSPETKQKIGIPIDLIRDIYHGMSFGQMQMARCISLPYGWYQLVDDDGEDYSLLVWEEQVANYSNIMRNQSEIRSNPAISPEIIGKEYFGGFGVKPGIDELGYLIRAIRNNDNESPQLFTFAERNAIDPVRLSEQLKQENIGAQDIKNWVNKVYLKHETLALQLFGNFDCFFDRVLEALKGRKVSPGDIKEIPVELMPFKIEPTHNLSVLAREVVDEMFNGRYDGIKSIEWTMKPLSQYYGCYNFDGSIQINQLLDSPQVDKEVVKFVIYHEMLHRDFVRHTPSFYAQEHRYPGYTEHNRFLDYHLRNIKLDFGDYDM